MTGKICNHLLTKYLILKDKIVNNEYKPGELLQIDRLAKELGVSSTPVFESFASSRKYRTC